MTDQYAVIGNPVEHSRSPDIHAAFAAQTGEDIEYGKLFAKSDAFADIANRFFAEGGRGLNVTVPFKRNALDFADSLAERAEAAGAVNTLIADSEHGRRGDNTDGAGLHRDLTHNHGLDLGNLRILILGAGGAVRGILGPLLTARPARLVIANRTPEKAASLAHHFGQDVGQSGPAQGIGFNETADLGPFDLVINGTSAGLSGQIPPLPEGVFSDTAVAYDMLYADQPTAFLRWADGLGVPVCIDGFGMLVEQAAESFYLWRGKRPDTMPIIAQLRPG